tara:strand:- start:3340 stop:3501 length:162 start_codon:yes stop_codon:yes gene_type:complete
MHSSLKFRQIAGPDLMMPFGCDAANYTVDRVGWVVLCVTELAKVLIEKEGDSK